MPEKAKGVSGCGRACRTGEPETRFACPAPCNPLATVCVQLDPDETQCLAVLFDPPLCKRSHNRQRSLHFVAHAAALKYSSVGVSTNQTNSVSNRARYRSVHDLLLTHYKFLPHSRCAIYES